MSATLLPAEVERSLAYLEGDTVVPSRWALSVLLGEIHRHNIEAGIPYRSKDGREYFPPLDKVRAPFDGSPFDPKGVPVDEALNDRIVAAEAKAHLRWVENNHSAVAGYLKLIRGHTEAGHTDAAENAAKMLRDHCIDNGYCVAEMTLRDGQIVSKVNREMEAQISTAIAAGITASSFKQGGLTLVEAGHKEPHAPIHNGARLHLEISGPPVGPGEG